MIVKTNSGAVSVNKRSSYAKWLQGWKDSGAWTGWFTLEKAWERANQVYKPKGCSWYALGYLMGQGAYQTSHDVEDK